jgi:hypothetical protein
LGWGDVEAGAEEGLRLEGTQGVADEHPPQGDDREPGVVPDGGVRGEVQGAGGAIVPGDGHRLPRGGGMVQALLEGGKALAFQAGAAFLPRPSGGCGYIERRVEAEAGDEGHGVGEGLTEVEEFQDGVGTVRNKDQEAVWEPAAELEDHLPRYIRELLGGLPKVAVVPLRGSEDGEEGQRPDALGPGDGGEPHETDPAEPAGLHKVALGGADGVAVDALGLDTLAPAALQGFIDPEDQRTLAIVKVVKEDGEEAMGNLA